MALFKYVGKCEKGSTYLHRPSNMLYCANSRGNMELLDKNPSQEFIDSLENTKFLMLDNSEGQEVPRLFCNGRSIPLEDFLQGSTEFEGESLGMAKLRSIKREHTDYEV